MGNVTGVPAASRRPVLDGRDGTLRFERHDRVRSSSLERLANLVRRAEVSHGAGTRFEQERQLNKSMLDALRQLRGS